MKLSYAEQLKHPSWQRRRLERLNVANWECENCGAKETTLHVHHRNYVRGRMAWEYQNDELGVLCETCHEEHHVEEARLREVLAQMSMGEVRCLLSGFVHGQYEHDPALLEEAWQSDPYTYALGFIAQLSNGLNIGELHSVARFVVGLHAPTAEARERYNGNLHIFGATA